MAKQKERSEVETLRAENRNLKKQIKHMKKEVGRVNKRQAIAEDMENTAREHLAEIEIERAEIKSKDGCPDCGRELDKTDLGLRWLVLCEECGYRRSFKKK